jgi:omega-hydroxy-beta-dihydromenaquinone-9 sulfotransferase
MRGFKEWRRRPQVIQGMTLNSLVRVLARNDFMVDTRCLGRLAYLLVMGVTNSIFGACETYYNQKDFDEVKIEHPPLFVLGHWRSGTTHLHNLLSLDETLASPTAYQASFPHHFVYSQVAGVIFNWIAPNKRPMDNVSFASHVPHEDEFALAAHSTVSPYMKLLFPVTGDNGYAELDPQHLSPRNLERWKESLLLFLKKLTLSEGKRILLKSPPHTARVGTLVEMFPGAQFVHIVRNPYMVFLSTRKLWKNSLSHTHLQFPSPEFVDELILSWYTELFSCFERDRGTIPAGSLHEMKFEDLETQPVETLRLMYENLGLAGFESFEPKLRSYLNSISGYQKNVYRLDDADREKIAERWRHTFECYGYAI